MCNAQLTHSSLHHTPTSEHANIPDYVHTHIHTQKIHNTVGIYHTVLHNNRKLALQGGRT